MAFESSMISLGKYFCSRFCFFKRVRAAYTDYSIGEEAKQGDDINLLIQRKSNSTRKDEPWMRFIKEQSRKRIETTFSEIKNLFLKKIHAVTFNGFLLKILMFVVAYTSGRVSSNLD